MDQEKLYQEYIEVTNALKALTQKKKVLGEQVFAKFEAEKLDKIEAPNGLITRVVRKVWKYPDELKNAVLALQKDCQESGAAKEEDSEFLKVSLR